MTSYQSICLYGICVCACACVDVCLLFAHLFRHEKLFNKRCECCRYIKNKQIICISLMQITQSGGAGMVGMLDGEREKEQVSLSLSVCGVVIKRLVIRDWQNGVRDINAAVNQKSNKTLHTFRRRRLITQIRLCVSPSLRPALLRLCVRVTRVYICAKVS